MAGSEAEDGSSDRADERLGDQKKTRRAEKSRDERDYLNNHLSFRAAPGARVSEVAYHGPSPPTKPSTQPNPTIKEDSGKEVNLEEGPKITRVAANVGDLTSNNREGPVEQLKTVIKTVTPGSGERQQGVGRGRGFRRVEGTDYRPLGFASRGPSATTSRIKKTHPALGGGLIGNKGEGDNRMPPQIKFKAPPVFTRKKTKMRQIGSVVTK